MSEKVSDWNSRLGKSGWLTVDEGVENRHGTVGDTSVGVDLLQDCKNGSADGKRWYDALECAPR